jgi:hypothetical protein
MMCEISELVLSQAETQETSGLPWFTGGIDD